MGSCTLIPDKGLYLLEEATSDSASSLLTEGTSAAGIALSVQNGFLDIIIFDSNIPHT